MFLWVEVNHPWQFETNFGEITDKKERLDCTMNLEGGYLMTHLLVIFNVPLHGTSKNRKGLSPGETDDSYVGYSVLTRTH